jgi:trehalose 6-phosphate synthase
MRQTVEAENHSMKPAGDSTRANAQVIVASNRGPVQFYRQTDGKMQQHQSSGGLATAFISLAAQIDLSWVAVAATPLERQAFADQPYRMIHLGASRVRARYVTVPDDTYKQYYNAISNSLLWFAQHYLLHPDVTPSFGRADQQNWEEGYRTVNQAMANALVETFRGMPADARHQVVVMIQDYHLYLVPALLRAALPEVVLTHFIHIPWPAVRYWQFLPQNIVLEILTSFLANDVIGMQTALDVRNLLTCIEELLPDAVVERTPEANRVTWRDHSVLVKAYPMSIDPAYIRALACSRAAQRGYRAISQHFDAQTILRVDRLEPTKNIVRGLHAFALLLEQHPELRGRVRFVMILVPSREDVPRYRKYAREVNKLVDEVNARYGEPEGAVVVPILGNDQARALAAMRTSDVMLVNSIIDGMHLGAKEFAVVNECNGVLVLSRTAGVAHELGQDAAFHVTPTDVQETADALYQALTLDSQERAVMAKAARRQVESHPITRWIEGQLSDAIRQAMPLAQAVPQPSLIHLP